MTSTPSTGQSGPRGQIAARVNAVTESIKQAAWPPPAEEGSAAARSPAAPVLLAHTARGFAVGGVVSSMLDRYALPRRDNFATCAHYCAQAMEALCVTLDPVLLRRYSEGASDADLLQLSQVAIAELHESAPEDIDVLAGSMVSLGAVLGDVARPIADDPDLPAAVRAVAGIAVGAADIVHSHYGGDGGGW